MNASPFTNPNHRLGWNELDMVDILRMIEFARSNVEYQTVSNICHNGVCSGDIIIESEEEKNKREKKAVKGKDPDFDPHAKAPMDGTHPNRSEPMPDQSVVQLTPEEENQRKQRSYMWAEFAREMILVEDAIGWVPIVAAPNTTHLSIVESDPLRPCVLNLDRVKIRHRKTLQSLAEFEFYEELDPTDPEWTRVGGGTFNSVENPFPGCRRIDNVKVVGNEMPTNAGTIHSRIKRLYYGFYVFYLRKTLACEHADKLRAQPPIVTKQAETKSGTEPSAATTFPDPAFPGMPAPNAEQMAQIERNYALCRAANRGEVGLDELYEGGGKRQRLSDTATTPEGVGLTQVQIELGRDLVANHMAEAPQDLLPTKQAFFETVCLAWSVPLSMISQGDSTGKAKLNTEGAGQETARVFREAQGQRKKRLELVLSDVYEYLYAGKLVHDKVKAALDAGADEDSEELAPEKLDKHARVTVRIPANPEFQIAMTLFQSGFTRYPAFVDQMCILTGMNPNDFNPQPQIPLEDLAGIAAPVEEGDESGGGGGGSKNKSKSKGKSGGGGKKK